MKNHSSKCLWEQLEENFKGKSDLADLPSRKEQVQECYFMTPKNWKHETIQNAA